MKLCSIAGCERTHAARGLCRRHYQHARLNGGSMDAIGAAFASGLKAERHTASYFRRSGRAVEEHGGHAPFDLLVDGWRIDVKSARMVMKQGHPQWQFDIHKHGKIRTDHTDFYVLRLVNVPYYKKTVYLLLKAPISTARLTIHFSALWSTRAAIDFSSFASGQFGRKPIPAHKEIPDGGRKEGDEFQAVGGNLAAN